MEGQGKACQMKPVAQEAAQIAKGGQAVVAEELLAEGAVLGVLTPQLVVGVRALMTARHLPAQAPLLLHSLQGPHGGRGAGLQPAGIDSGQCEAQEQQEELVGQREDKVSHSWEAGGAPGHVLVHPQRPRGMGDRIGSKPGLPAPSPNPNRAPALIS